MLRMKSQAALLSVCLVSLTLVSGVSKAKAQHATERSPGLKIAGNVLGALANSLGGGGHGNWHGPPCGTTPVHPPVWTPPPAWYPVYPAYQPPSPYPRPNPNYGYGRPLYSDPVLPIYETQPFMTERGSSRRSTMSQRGTSSRGSAYRSQRRPGSRYSSYYRSRGR